MTKIKFYVSGKSIVKFEINGHTDFNTYGNDIVCASISSTVLMIINGLLEVAKVDVKYTIESGYVSCEMLEVEKAQVLVKTLYKFLHQLSQDYPKNVKLETKEV